MVALFVVLTFAIAIAVDVLVVKRLAETRAQQIVEAKAQSQQQMSEANEAEDILFHQGHTWVRVRRAVVEVGLDDFTHRFVGDITKVDVPEPGTRIAKGKKAWTIHFGDRSLTQLAPISGMVFEVNTKAMKDPHLIGDSPYKEGWIMKLLPDALSQELPDLYTPSRFLKWIDLQKARFVRESFPELGLVYGDGEKLVHGVAQEIEADKWELIARKLFGEESKR